MQQLAKKDETQKEEIVELRKDYTNLKEKIRQLETKQTNESREILSLKKDHLTFTVAVKETLKNIWQNQSANDKQLRDMITNLKTGKLPFKYMINSI